MKTSREIDYRTTQTSNVSDIYSTLRNLEISIVDSCNRSCSFCPHDDPNYTFRYGRAELKLFETIANQLIEKDYTGSVVLCGYGEPTMYKQLNDAIKIIRKTNCNLELITNGELLTQEKVKTLFDSGLDIINISIYEEQYVEHVRTLVSGLNDSQYLIRNRYLNEISLVNRKEIVSQQSSIERTHECWLPAYKMLINYNGDVLLCCNDWTRTSVFGNIYTESLWDIWTFNMSQKRANLLNGVIDGVCKKCNINGTDYGKESRDYFKRN